VTESLFGPIYATWDIEQAVTEKLRLWIPEYLAEIERKRGLHKRVIPRPPAPESIHGGLDAETWDQADCPEVIVIVDPFGEPEREASVGMIQPYEVRVVANVVGQGSELAEKPEDEARAVASYYGAAVMGVLTQNGELKGIPTQEDSLVMMQSPGLTFPDPSLRQVIQATTIFHAWAEIVNANEGPVQDEPKESPQYGGEPEAEWKPEPTVSKTTETIKAVKISEPT
jgi:hypothetical protein